MKRKAIVILPTYNEKGNIKPLLEVFDQVIPQVQGNWQLELLFVDDNSPDGTAQEIGRLSKQFTTKKRNLTYKQIHLFNNPDKQGLGKAYLIGMEVARQQYAAEVMIQFDADLSHDATKIPQMLRLIDQGYDMVVGSRYVAGGSIPDNWHLHRKLLSGVGNQIIRFGLGNPEIKDWTTGFRAFTKKVHASVVPHLSDEQFFGYTIMIGFLNTAVKEGFKVTEVPFAFVDRTYGQSKLGVEYIFNTLAYIASARLTNLIKKSLVFTTRISN